MPYRVVDLENVPGVGTFESRVQELLNGAENEGWTLVQAMPGRSGAADGPYLVLHKDKPPRKEWRP
ncbi:hypothetical protein [Pimelobacter simplex]|uniref:hypothetical protein n=1 Tax=Nocardioides simplex TaxID=2045 RepID=UPI00214F8BF7|nr:hypothetical protein [Pimelobacter simplex]UUW88094.1 hypothetical protein M0M43_20450 [Pimelobacter simplex]UUW97598.1 hypothetical protein M0M48_09095 [Pimelobacter simplex]